MELLKRILQAVRIGWFYFKKEPRGKRFIIRQAGTHPGIYEVHDTMLGGTIHHDNYVFLKADAQAIADAMNSLHTRYSYNK